MNNMENYKNQIKILKYKCEKLETELNENLIEIENKKINDNIEEIKNYNDNLRKEILNNEINYNNLLNNKENNIKEKEYNEKQNELNKIKDNFELKIKEKDKIIKVFQNYIQQGNYYEAAKIASQTQGDILRNINTINMFKQLKGYPQPILVYFQTIMEKDKLNGIESIEICRPLVAQNRTDLLNKWFNEDRFTCTEQLSELVKGVDQDLSYKILMKS